MRSKIVRIGNSQGVRIPKALIEQTGLTDEVEIRVVDNQLVIAPATPPRAGWDAFFEKMASQGDDELLDGDVVIATAEDAEWEW